MTQSKQFILSLLTVVKAFTRIWLPEGNKRVNVTARRTVKLSDSKTDDLATIRNPYNWCLSSITANLASLGVTC